MRGFGTVAAGLNKRPQSLRNVLICIIAAAAIPLLAFSGLLLSRYADSLRAQAQQQLTEGARGLARDIDSEFGAAEAVLLALAASAQLANEDLSAFGRELRAVAAATGRDLALVDASGRAVVTTNDRFVVPLLADRIDPADPRPIVTDVLIGPDGSASAHVVLPMVRDGAVRRTLHAVLASGQFSSILANPGVPKDWIVSIVDPAGTHLVRSHLNEQFAGKPLVPVLAEHVRQRQTGILPTVSLEGIPLVSTAAYGPSSGWVAAIGLPRSTLDAPVREQLTYLIVLGVAAVTFALGLGLLLAHALNDSVKALAHTAGLVGSDAPVAFAPSPLREVNHLAQVLGKTSDELQARSRRLAELNASLEGQVRARTAELTAANMQLRDEIARREQSETQVRQMQKMEAIGQLTGGIAHDFNNMLAVVTSSLHLLRRRLRRGDLDVQKYVDSALDGTQRAANLVSRLLSFSRQQPLSPEVVDANKLLAGMAEILRRTIPENVRIEAVQAGGLWRTRIDRPGLEAALLNLAVNARDAMPEGGKLTVETANAYLDEAYAAAHPETTAGRYVMVAVTDTGHGMDREVMSRAFDPFFTTKPMGMGTGLGLSQVYGFIKQSGGHVKIYSERGVGTTVKLYLPRCVSELEAEGAAADAPVPQHAGNGRLVLVVEDEEDVRRLTMEMLTELGYRVVAAADGERAMAALDEHPATALLLTDVVMPGMNGRRLADAAVGKYPHLKVAFMTGYTRNAIVHNGVLDEGVHLLIKPFTIESLAAKLAEVFHEPGR